MSTSAADHYKVSRSLEKLEFVEYELYHSRDNVEACQAELEHIQTALDQAQQHKIACEVKQELAEEEVQKATKQAETKKEDQAAAAATTVEVDPTTGLPPGQKIGATPQEMFYGMLFREAQECMQDGNLEQAQKLDQKATSTQTGMEILLNTRAVGVVAGAFQVNHADFIRPFTLPDPEVLVETFRFARENPTRTDPKADNSREDLDAMFDLFVGRNPALSSSYPKNVNAAITKEIREQQQFLTEANETS